MAPVEPSDSGRPIEAVGTVYVLYDPGSPLNWAMVHFYLNVPVFRDATHALVALKRHVRELQEPRILPANRPRTPILFRGHRAISARLLPTRLRGQGPLPVLGPKYAAEIAPGTPADVREAIRTVHGTWSRREKIMRSMQTLASSLPPTLVEERDQLERKAISAARRLFPEIAALDPLRQQAAARHYAEVPSPLLDVTEDPDVATFFATGAKTRADEEYGMLWAVDIGRLAQYFTYDVVPVPGGERIILNDQRDRWGDNKQFFDEQNLPPVTIEIANVAVPLPRPTAQRGRFLSIAQSDCLPMSVEAELVWWSMIERWSYAFAFIQTGEVYENLQAGVTAARLLPEDDPYRALKHVATSK